jgi:mono/diheme cytochrome c family protein
MKARNIFVILLMQLLVASCSDSNERSNPSVSSVQEETGQQLFESKCVACHGTDGTAGIGNAANLKKSKLDSNELFKTIKEGRNGMPSFNRNLSEAQISKLTAYVRSLRQ